MAGITDIKDSLAKGITKYVLICTAILVSLGIILAVVVILQSRDNPENAGKIADSGLKVLQFVFASILPLLGTWIGTILAFYFSKENFTAANESVRTLVDKITSDKKLASINAKEKMIKLADINKYTTPYDDISVENTILLKEMLSYLNQINRNRLVLLSSKNQAKMVIHKSIITEFIAMNANSFETCTLKDMRDSGTERIKRIIDNSVAFIDENATMQTAKKKMDEKNGGGKEEICQDIFLTATGNADEPVLGWITEVEIAKNSVVE
jgi:hypothetical protein